MMNPQSSERPLAFHLARKVPYLNQQQDQKQQFVQGSSSIEITGSPEMSFDLIYDF